MTEPGIPPETASLPSGGHGKVTGDFDFLVGTWRVTHRYLKERLANSPIWAVFDATMVSRTYFNGAISVDEFDLAPRAARGLALRLFEPGAGRWSIYWVDSRDGLLAPPVHGSFTDGVGTFFGDDVHDGRPVRVRYRWSDITATTARWEQAFSIDGGGAWETNWIMMLERVPDSSEGLIPA